MTIKEEYLAKIDAIPTVSYNKEQKEIAKKILSNTPDEDLSKIFGLLSQRVKTGFVFDEAPEINHDCVAIVKENESLGINVNQTGVIEHKLIIGENYDVLKNLCATYIDPKTGKGLIDFIYIDPPYNTEKAKEDGNDYKENVEAKKFIYRDKFTRDGWLNMMNERLQLARKLLTDDGVIFISIDDNEQAYLKVLCDEILGERNFIGQLILKTATDNNPSQINIEHEYMVCYAKNRSTQGNWIRQSAAAERIVQQYNELKESCSNNEEIQTKLRQWIKTNKDSLPQVAHYNNVDDRGVYSSSSNSSNPHPGGYMFEILHPITGLPCPKPANGWRWPESTFKDYDEAGEIEWGKDHTTQPHVKKRIETSMEYLRSLIYEDNRATTKMLADLFNGRKVFDNPKPVNVLSRIMEFVTKKDSVILDFFAGSGTTGQAVMELNVKDKGHRRFILATNNENNIGDIIRERLYRVINGIGSNGEAIKWEFSKDKPYLDGNSVRVFNIEYNSLSLEDLSKAELLAKQAKTEFIKLNENYAPSTQIDVYNALSALNPYKIEED